MPRYYFDVADGRKQYTDDEGEELQGDDAARSCARAMLTENVDRAATNAEIRVRVRDGSGDRFAARLSITVD